MKLANTMDILWALRILIAWCFSTRPSVASMVSMHPCVSSCWCNGHNIWSKPTISTHEGLSKMDANLQTQFLIQFLESLHYKKDFTEVCFKWVQFDEKPALVQIMAWCCQVSSETWTNVVHMASLGHNELKHISWHAHNTKFAIWIGEHDYKLRLIISIKNSQKEELTHRPLGDFNKILYK